MTVTGSTMCLCIWGWAVAQVLKRSGMERVRGGRMHGLEPEDQVGGGGLLPVVAAGGGCRRIMGRS
jgi:hypothetical protein